MKLAIADPPYLGRANRWYGDGVGHGHGIGRADSHPDASMWDDPQTHIDMVAQLERDFEGWAIALTVHSLSTYMGVIPTSSTNGIRVMAWVKPSSVPSGSRISTSWEPVIVRVPESRRGHLTGESMRDFLMINPLRSGFIGSKPPAWTHWVLQAMGYEAGDEIHDMFEGSGAVNRAVATYGQALTIDFEMDNHE